jgi:hypothetical protein
MRCAATPTPASLHTAAVYPHPSSSVNRHVPRLSRLDKLVPGWNHLGRRTVTCGGIIVVYAVVVAVVVVTN